MSPLGPTADRGVSPVRADGSTSTLREITIPREPTSKSADC
jgi:hypothetical protein